MDDKRVKEVAQDFLTSWRAQLWPLVTDDVRHALIDSAVMHCVRMADVVDNNTPLLPSQLVDFRNQLITRLRFGVRTGGHRCLRLDQDADTPEE